MWPRCVLHIFDSKPDCLFGVVCWSGLSDVCQNQINQIDILISLSWLGGPSFHFFLSLCFCLFFSSLLCFLCSPGISCSQGVQKWSGSWDCGVGHKGQRKHLKNISPILNTVGILVTCKPPKGAWKPDNQVFVFDLSWLSSNPWPLRTTETQKTCSGFCGFFAYCLQTSLWISHSAPEYFCQLKYYRKFSAVGQRVGLCWGD